VKKIFIIGGSLVVGLVILIAIVLFFVISSLDSLVKAAVEKYGSEVTQVKVKLREAEISATSGQAALRGLVVGNPEGFKTESAYSLGEIRVAIDVGTITENPVVIKEIVILEPQVTYELGLKGSNIDAIQRNVDSYAKQGKSGGASSKESDDQGRKLVIEHLYIRNGKVNVSSTMLPGKKASAALPTIHLTDIGKKGGGATPGEIAEKVLTAVSQGVGKAVATPDIANVLGAAGAGTATQEAVKSVGESMKGIFGN